MTSFMNGLFHRLFSRKPPEGDRARIRRTMVAFNGPMVTRCQMIGLTGTLNPSPEDE